MICHCQNPVNPYINQVKNGICSTLRNLSLELGAWSIVKKRDIFHQPKLTRIAVFETKGGETAL